MELDKTAFFISEINRAITCKVTTLLTLLTRILILLNFINIKYFSIIKTVKMVLPQKRNIY